MNKLSNKTLGKAIFLSVFGLSLLFAGIISVNQVSAATTNAGALTTINDPNAWVCNVLNSLGISCGTSKSNVTYTGTSSTNSNSTSSTSNSSALGATIYTAGVKSTGSNAVILVRVPGQSAIYEIIGGQKHLIPTMDIFYDYGLKLGMVQDITARNLAKYPRVNLIMVNGDKTKTYYLTEGGMVRLIPDKTVFDSYADSNDDVISVSKKEFNFYPKNQFVFLENPLNRDVFQIVNGTKRYLTPMAVQRLAIIDDQVAPVNGTELAFYKTGKPVVY